MGNVKLINLRGRVLTVNEVDVPLLLKKGFLFLPADQPDLVYSQIHDKGTDFKESDPKLMQANREQKPRIGNILEVEAV